MNNSRIKFTSDNFRIVEVKFQSTVDNKGKVLIYGTHSVLEEKKINSLGEAYYAPVPEMHYGNFDLMMNITQAYDRFIKDIK